MGVLGAIAAVLIAVSPADKAAARAHYEQGLAEGKELRFLWQPEMDANLTAAVMYQVVASSRQPLLDGTVPYRVPGTNLLAIDLNMLSWRVKDWQAICGYENNGYVSTENPLTVPAGWFLNEVADGRESDAYLRFVFSGNVPKTEDEFLKAFGVDRKAQAGLQYGWIEGESAVNVNKDSARLVEYSDGLHASAYVTYDVQNVRDDSDPLRGLFAGGFRHDASEFYVLTPKVSTDGARGIFPFTGLADGQGRIVTDAPEEIVIDHSKTFGSDTIVNPGGCVSCHNEGSKRPSVNALKHLLTLDHHEDFPKLQAYPKQKQVDVDLFHGGDVTESLDRWDRDYAVALKAVNGLTPLENAQGYRAALKSYRDDVTPERAAAELSVDVRTMELAIGYAQANYVDVGPRVVKLAHGESIPRSSYENEYLKLRSYLEAYSK